MRKDHSYLYSVNFLDSLLQGLNRAGAPLPKLISQGLIRKFDLDNPSTYLPISVFHEFLLNVKASQGVDHFGSQFYSSFRLKELGEYGGHLESCPDLLTLLQEAIKYEFTNQTNSRLHLAVDGPVCHFFQRTFDPPSEGRRIAEEIAFTMMVEGLNFVHGKDWKPISIQIPWPDVPWLDKVIDTSRATVQFNHAYHGFTFETRLLFDKNKFSKASTPPKSKPVTNFTGLVFTLIQGMRDGFIPSLEDFSGFLNLHKRTITRKLRAEGTSFHTLLKRYYFARSVGLLEQTNLSVKEISQQLGYANESNFIRAFQGWTNTTPSKYRKQRIGINA